MIAEEFSGDYKTLRNDFNQAAANMAASMQRVLTRTRNVEASAREMGEASADLAHQTEQQAGQLEEAAAALEKLVTSVKESSANATGAARLAGAARADATASGQVVKDTVEAMAGIERSSHEISNIISVIDEIAFQTNLLALNAGVEAARAGGAGPGFAVVATEVRSLAQRSADAAKEIKAIISTSATQVGNGVKLVSETGNTLQRITGQINELSDRVREIAASASQQSDALNQINGVINQMEHTTQKNAAMVEQTAAASVSLASDAAALTLVVGEFRLSDRAEPMPKPASQLRGQPQKLLA